jgi:hypothetical protein
MSGVAVILLALLAKQVHATDLIDCLPEEFSAEHPRLFVAFMATTKKDTCELQSPQVDEDKMNEYCEKFCATDGKPYSLPLLLGNTAYGFNLEQMSDICSSVGSVDMDRLAECRRKRTGLFRIQKQTAKFIGANEVLVSEQLAFQATMADESKKFREVLTSELFREEVALAGTDNRAEKIREKFAEFSLVGKLDDAGTEMKAAIDELNTTGQDLKKVVSENLQDAKDYFEECNQFFVAYGAEGEVLLDICPQGSTDCVEHEDGEHVGCCCALNPVTIPAGVSYRIDGITAVEGGTVDATRRQLQLDAAVPNRVLQVDEAVDVCAEAHERSDGDKSTKMVTNFKCGKFTIGNKKRNSIQWI